MEIFVNPSKISFTALLLMDLLNSPDHFRVINMYKINKFYYALSLSN